MRHQRRPRTLPAGTISHGTLRTDDLCPALFSEVDRIRLTRADRVKVRQLQAEWGALPASDGPMGPDWTDDQHDTAQGVYDDLLQLAESYLPPYCTLGMHDGDGSDLGVWPCVESLQDGVWSGAVWQEIDGEDPDGCYQTEYQAGRVRRLGVPRGDLYIVVSDHGNLTLYRSLGAGKSREIWGVV